MARALQPATNQFIRTVQEVVVFCTPYGNVRIITSINTPKDEVLFIDSEGKTVGVIKLGGTPNIYRRIVLE